MIAIALENEMKDRTKRQFFNIFIEKMRDKYMNHIRFILLLKIYSSFSNLSCIWSHWDSYLFAASLRLSGIWDFWSPPATESYSDYLKSIEYVPFITALTLDLVLINHSFVTKRWQILKHRSHLFRQVFTSGIWDFWSPPTTESYSDYVQQPESIISDC
jgi:hypothetical protein